MTQLSTTTSRATACVFALLGAWMTSCGSDGQSSPSPPADAGVDATPRDASAPCVTPECLKVVAVAAGTAHACALLADGKVRCWGGDVYRQLGDGVTSGSAAVCNVLGESVPCEPRATIVPGIDDAVKIAAGGATTCALRRGGEVVCWGLNESGELGHPPRTGGDGECAGRACNGAPSIVAGISGAQTLAVGSGFACAAGVSGLSCWGRNDLGQLGRGTVTAVAEPAARVDLERSALALAARSHACAVLDNGALRCWGSNDRRAISMDDGTEAETCRAGSNGCFSKPRAIMFDTSDGGAPPVAKSVAIADGVTCVLDAAGALFCGGTTKYGGTATGDGGNGVRFITRIASVPPVAHVAGGASHLCAIATDGSTFCWGTSGLGQLGTGVPVADECYAGDPKCAAKPIRATGADGVEKLAAGADFVVASTRDGILGWGFNVFGQTGRSPSSAGDVPCAVAPDLPLAVCAFAPTRATVVFTP
jgi:alpha-tubulin suppressor-like RCC1 family protein